MKIADNLIFRHSRLIVVLPRHVLQISALQITEHKMAKSRNLKYLTEALDQNS